MHCPTITALITALSFAAPALAVYGPGPYVGGGLGYSTIDALDDNSTSLRLQGGYQFNPYLAVEAGVDALAMIEREYCYYDYCGASEEQNVYGLSFGLTGALPLGDNFNLLAKTGILLWESSIDDDRAADGSNPYYAFGGSYQFRPHMELALLYSRYQLDGFADTLAANPNYGGDNQISNVALLFNYRF